MADYDKATGNNGTLRMRITFAQSQANNTTTFTVTYYLINTNSATFFSGVGWSGNTAGTARSGTVSMSGAQTKTLGSWTVTKTHDASGNLSAANRTFTIHLNATGTSGVGGPTDNSVTITVPRIPKVAGAPPAPAFVSSTASTLTFTIQGPSDNGGSTVTSYRMQVLTENVQAGGADIVADWTGTSSPQTSPAVLSPNTRYRVRYLAINGVGQGAWSSQVFMDTAPGVPGTPAVGTVTTTSVMLTWASGGNGPLTTGYDLEYSTNADFSGATLVSLGNVTTHTVTPLNPGTTYYFRVRARSATAVSGWSGSRSQSTLPATPPGMTVTPSLNGQSATVALTPPGGSTGVTKYRVEYQPLPSGSVVAVESATSPIVVNGLTPGQTYQWRASAFFGTYQSPFTAWTPVIQPNPSTSPGDYFDGSTAPRGDLTFAWTGTANNSISRANGVGVEGWAIANGSGGGDLRLQRVTGGRSGAYAARMLVTRDLPAVGGHLGMNPSTPAHRAEVEADATYVGSIYVRPSRAQPMRVEIVWYNAAGAEVVPRAIGENVLVNSTDSWTRLIVTGVAPAGAETAIVRARDVTGTGFTEWKSGEWLDADDAMVTLSSLFPWFSGDTPDGGGFEYDWLGTANASVSSRTTVAQDASDPLDDPDCPAPPAPPSPPAIEDDCIIDVGLWRRYWVQVPASEVTTWIATIPTLTITTGAQEAREVRMRVYDNPDDVPPSGFTALEWQSEQIIRYMPPHTTFVVDGVSERARASVDGGDWIAADHLLYGSGGAPATWPLLDCGSGYLISLDVPLDSDLGNITADLALTRRML